MELVWSFNVLTAVPFWSNILTPVPFGVTFLPVYCWSNVLTRVLLEVLSFSVTAVNLCVCVLAQGLSQLEILLRRDTHRGIRISIFAKPCACTLGACENWRVGRTQV